MYKVIAIANQSLHITELRKHFLNVPIISVDDIIQFYKGFKSDIKRSTVDWRIYALKSEGVLHRISRGSYSLHKVNHYKPAIARSSMLLFNSFKKLFPFVDVCLWNTKWLNEFMLHQPGRYYTILEVERDLMESVFYGLKELDKEAFLNPSAEVFDHYISTGKHAPLIIINLVSEAPTQEIDGVTTVTLEKMLVDLFCNETLFGAQQGAELVHIFRSAHEKYALSETRLLRYAARRNKKEGVRELYQMALRNGRNGQ